MENLLKSKLLGSRGVLKVVVEGHHFKKLFWEWRVVNGKERDGETDESFEMVKSDPTSELKWFLMWKAMVENEKISTVFSKFILNKPTASVFVTSLNKLIRIFF